MADVITPARRSAIMARIGPQDTVPEMAVRRLVLAMGLRFRLHRRDLPGRPDLVFPKLKLALFVHGCFWHRHEGCSNCTFPKTRSAFWETKFRTNVERDARVERELKVLGWTTAVIWECETEKADVPQARLVEIADSCRSSGRQNRGLGMSCSRQ
jgi:DNA mismatch endonuclease (patch repair protein)